MSNWLGYSVWRLDIESSRLELFKASIRSYTETCGVSVGTFCKVVSSRAIHLPFWDSFDVAPSSLVGRIRLINNSPYSHARQQRSTVHSEPKSEP